jgi:LytS/YehU family sensor histidine kinase
LAHQKFDSVRHRSQNGSFPQPPRFKERGQFRMIRKEMDILVLLILSVAVSTSIRITGTWYSNEKERKEMENQKLTAELILLKSQINPHFFFNTLNSIYSLAIQKSDKTPEAIVKLSEIMRYIIYEADKNQVSLKKELEYIRNYVELQRLRLMSNVKVNYSIEGIYNDIMVEPLLFLPFIENAFKHGIDSIKDCEIKIKFVITSGLLLFRVENPLVQQSKKQPSDSSGIGLANTKKRLQLLYPENHELKVTQTEDHFIVELSIKIRQHELHNS